MATKGVGNGQAGSRVRPPSAKVELAISARKLPDMDVFSVSDPMCVLYKKEFGQHNWVEHGRTEWIKNNLNPDFQKKFILEYFFEERQFLKFELYDIDSPSQDLGKHDFLGSMETTLSHIVSCVKIDEPLQDKKRKRERGTIIVTAEKKNDHAKEILHLTFHGENMAKNDTYLEIHKENEDGSFTLVKRTEKAKSKKTAMWKDIDVTVAELCNGDWDRTLKFCGMCGSKLVGEFETKLRTLSRGPANTGGSQNIYDLENKQAKDPKKNQCAGVIRLVQYSMESQYTILDHIQEGCQIKVAVAVDFTQSNGDPLQPSSLHYFAPGSGTNHYSRAIEAVVGILQEYDSDKMIPAYGFGAKHPRTEECMDVFPLNGNAEDPNCSKEAGVIEAYHRAIQRVKMFGPTNFAPIIATIAEQAEKKLDGSEYHILLILTDGNISDMNDTKKVIVQRASKLPMSIIIVGIGDENFQAMEILDGDNKRLSFRREEACRDIVQFVAYRDFDPKSLGDETKGHLLLAKEVLAEVPDQFMSYMRDHNYRPRKSNRVSTLV